MKKNLLIFLILLLLVFFTGCSTEPAIVLDDYNYMPVINPDDFVTVIDNPYMPLIPGTVTVYEGREEEDVEKIIVEVTYDTRVVMGVTCTVVRDRVYENGELTEDTFDWFAQDIHGNVWYFGEISKEYDEGTLVSFEGSWESGKDGALPGIVMPANLKIGDAYYQEYYKDEAEDMGEVVSLNESVIVPFGSYDNCIKTKDWNPFEPKVVEYKYYAKGIGVVLEEETGQRVELIDVLTLDELDINKIVEGDIDDSIGLDAFVEIGVADVNDDERVFYITPGFEWEVFDTDLVLGFEWEIPVAPDAEIGEITVFEEFEIEVEEEIPVIIYFGNENTFILGEMPEFDEDGEEIEVIERFEGLFLVGAEFFEIPFIELDLTYLPEIELGAIVGAGHEFVIKNTNIIGLEAALNIIFFEDPGFSDIEFDAYYSKSFFDYFFTLTVGIEPVIEIEKLEDESGYEAGFVITPYAVFSFAF